MAKKINKILQTTTQKTKDWATRNTLKAAGAPEYICNVLATSIYDIELAFISCISLEIYILAR